MSHFQADSRASVKRPFVPEGNTPGKPLPKVRTVKASENKQFYQESTKILNEFGKRIDPNLAFYYWTGVKERYRDFALPSFNCPTGPGIVERLDGVKLSRRGDPGVFVSNRASLPQRGQLTARAHFHKTPVALPPSQV